MFKRKAIAILLSCSLFASLSIVFFASNNTEAKERQSLAYETPQTNYSSTNYSDYITYRTPLTNTYKKLTENKELTVVYFGDALTAEENSTHSWRVPSKDWLKTNFSDAVIKTINSAISEGDSFLGTYRLQKDVIAHKPDLLFVEYTIGDMGIDEKTAATQFETIVREVRTALPYCDIVVMLTSGNDAATGHDKIAEAYDLPVVKFETTMDEYWPCLEEYLANSLLYTDYTNYTRVERALPTVYSDNLLDGNRLFDTGIAMKKFFVADASSQCKYNTNTFSGGNDTPYNGSYNVAKDGTITFKFNGTEFGIWTDQKSGATIQYVIDNEPPQTMECSSFALTQIVSGIQEGEHTISITPTTLEENTSVMKIGGVFSRDASEQTAKGFPIKLLSVEDFKTQDKYPTQARKLFAGWYDEACENPFTGDTGNAWAKFVDDYILGVKLQLSENVTVNSDKTNVRFITSIDTLKFRCVGFEVERPGKTYDLQETTAYTSIRVEDGVVLQATPVGTFGSTAEYFVVHTLANVPNSHFDTVFKVKPYWYTMDGTKVYGETRTFTVNELIMNGAMNQDNDIVDHWEIKD